MQAVWFDAFGVRPRLRDVPEPRCPEAGVVIEVAATGLCRSDWHGWLGHDPDIPLPHVPGHEFAGTVVEAGPRVTRSLVGKRVTVPFVCACGSCVACLEDEQQVCLRQTQPGFTGWGSFADLVAIDHAGVNVVVLPPGLDFATAASLGCRFATAYRAVTVHGRPAAGECVVVHGCGGVGLSIVMIASAAGARVIAVDVSPGALRLAADFGAQDSIDATGIDDVARRVRELTDGGAQVSFDALGSAVTAANSIRCLRPRGRHVQVGLLAGEDAENALPLGRVLAAELQFFGSHGMPAHAYPPMLTEIAAGRLQPQRLITRHITLADAPGALAAMGDSPTPGITIIRPSEGAA
jgi:D-arabinose 1-dehydrogenase-like Zn-dependent alcohol dehydrogenase